MLIIKKLIAIFILLVLNSCNLLKENGIGLKIKNNSNSSISNIQFYTTEKLSTLIFNKIEPNKNLKGFLSMKNNKSDGAYTLEFTRLNGKKENFSSGYYTNGKTLDSLVEFEIKEDTILVKYTTIKY